MNNLIIFTFLIVILIIIIKKIRRRKKLRLLFTDNPKDFVLVIEPAWFSDNYVQFKYSGNGGLTFKKIRCCHEPFLGLIDYDYTFEVLTYKLNKGNFDYEKERFSSVSKIESFMKEEYDRFKEGNENLRKQREKIRIEKFEKFKNLNK